MTDDKTRVKDLSTELGVSTKDLLHTLRDLDIPAKSVMTTLTADEVARVRERHQGQTAEAGVDRKVVQPGVIVRRRRRDGEEGEAPVRRRAEERETAEAAHAEAEAPASPASGDAPVAEERPTRAARAEAPAAPEARAAAPAARIIRRPDEAAPAAPAAEAPAQPAQAATAAETPAEAAPAAPVAPVAPVAADAGDKPAEAKAEKAATPTARIIRPARPDASAVPDATPQPSILPPVASEAAPRGEGMDGDEDDADGNRRRKKKRTPDVPGPQVRVISRPDPSAPAPRPYPPREGDRTDRGDRPGYGGDRQGYAPRPGGPGGDRPGYGGDRQGYAPRPGGPGGDRQGYAPRPGGPGGDRPAYAGDRQGYAPRPAGPGGPGGDRPGYAPRPGGPGGPGGYRPGGPGGPRPGGPGGPGGYGPRPGGPGGPGGPGAGQPPSGDEGQSKKKRLKGRRTVDFQAGADRSPRGREDDDFPRGGARRGKGRKGRDIKPAATQPLKAAKRKIKVEEAIRVADMAHQMGLKSTEIIKVLFGLGVMATINQSLDIDTATLVASEFGYEVEKVGFSEDDYLIPKEEDAPETMQHRPPVVTIMGHVDHGKTSLLDAIRKTNVTMGEAGGITQHIGAYHVTTKKGEIVFLDTPGHEAFTAMRARGAQVTDIVVLVVAADDGVMEQTREAVNHSKAAGVPIMVAVNKMDKEGANPERVQRELAELGLVSEAWGGDTVFSHVSAKTRQGLDELLELLALQAEILELKANPDKPARGHIVEAKLDKGRGPVATVLIQEGTLRQGDTFVCGVFSGRVRAMFNDQGKKVKEAGPAMPVEVQGFEGVPEAGEEFVCVTDEKLARRIAETRAVKQREKELARESKVTLETFLSRRVDDQEALVLNLVVKADVQGSLEAISEALRKLSTEKVRINIIHGGAGAISESDILLASASDAIIIGFNVRPTAKVKDIAEQENVDIRFYDIIYKLVDEVKSAMEGMLAPVQREVYLGQVEVRQTFSVPKVGTIAGCHVADGKITRNAGVRLLRDGVVIYTGKITSLKRFKDDMKEVMKGYECGVGLENFNDIKIGDIIEAFEMVEEAATL
jgi:translation initiation factor IF-2